MGEPASRAAVFESSVDILVTPRRGYTIEAWIGQHEDKNMAREVELIGPNALAEGQFLVRVKYTARGAARSDVMRPYRESKEWIRVADCSPLTSKREKKGD